MLVVFSCFDCSAHRPHASTNAGKIFSAIASKAVDFAKPSAVQSFHRNTDGDEMSTTTLTITTELLREWQACKDGYSWFVSKFPQGGAYEDVQSALKADKRADDLRWLTDRMFESLLKTPSLTALAVKWFQADAPDFEVASVNAEDAPAHDQDYAQIGSSGDAARIGSSGSDSFFRKELFPSAACRKLRLWQPKT